VIDLFLDETFLAILGVNLLLAWGLYLMVATGQLSVGQAGFMAIGAYAASWFSVELGWPIGVAIAVGAVASALVAVPVAIGGARMRGVSLIIGTLAVGEIIVTVIGTIDAVGGRGSYQVTSPIGPAPILLACAAIASMVVLLEHSRWGVAARAIRDDEAAAAASGVPARRLKIAAVVLGAAITGVAGGLKAHNVEVIATADFGVEVSFLIVLFVLIGGGGHWLGPAVGATVLTFLPQAFDAFDRYDDIVYGLSLILLLVVSPDGLITRGRVRAVVDRLVPGAVGRAPLVEYLDVGPPLLEPGGDRVPVLVVSGARKRFSGVTALDGVDLEVRPGEILGLIGPNGAGKSTLVHLATGLLRPTEGTVWLDRADVTRLPPESRTRRGIARTFQEVRLFPRLTVGETIWLAARFGRGSRRPGGPHVRGLDGRRDRLPPELPFATLRKVQLAQALATMPVALFLDEPTAGLDEAELRELRETITALRAWGTAVVLIDHNLDVVMEVADRVAVLEAGRKIAEGTPEAVRSDPLVQAAYLGGRRQARGGTA